MENKLNPTFSVFIHSLLHPNACECASSLVHKIYLNENNAGLLQYGMFYLIIKTRNIMF
jgi:hypothetical protein